MSTVTADFDRQVNEFYTSGGDDYQGLLDKLIQTVDKGKQP